MNFLFKSDNFDILNELLETQQNSIKCVYLDPPYNTGENRKHFKDDRNSNEWIEMMRARIEILAKLLKKDGSIWISIDDSELYNLKHLCDEVFGKDNFLANVVWQHRINWSGYKGKFQLDHSYLLGYRKSSSFNFENSIKPRTVWLESEVGGQADAFAESKALFGDTNTFSTPKPESLMRYLLELTTKEGDCVLDGFSGSGTMGAAAQKMNRRWIMIEIGDQCETHILPRIKKLTSQIDQDKASSDTDSNSFIYFSNLASFRKYRENSLHVTV